MFSAALVAAAVGCASETAPPAQTPSPSVVASPSPSKPAVDPAVAFTQYEDALRPFSCSDAVGDMVGASFDDDRETTKRLALEYREVLATWHERLGVIAFPAAVEPIITKMRSLIGTEQADLDAIRTAGPDVDLNALAARVGFTDWSLVSESDRVVAALGRPEHPARLAANQLELAYYTFHTDIEGVWDAFEDALVRNDLAAAKAANAIEEVAAQRYLDRLDDIAFPAGFKSQVNSLRNHLRGIIEYNRRQVDVATAADIVRSPDEGTPDAIAANDAKFWLFDDLKNLAAEEDPGPTC